MCELDLETDAVDAADLSEWSQQFSACNQFAFWYVENVNEDAVVQDIFTEWGKAHCVVYDPDADAVIDATLGQFGTDAVAGAWEGDEHPHAGPEEAFEWDSRDEFESHYEGGDSPFVL